MSEINSISNSGAYFASKLSPFIELNGKLYRLTVLYKKPNQSEWKEVTDSYLKLAHGIDFQEIIQENKVVSCKRIEIQADINSNSISCKVQGVQSEDGPRKIPLTHAQKDKIFQILNQIKSSRENHPLREINSANRDCSLSQENLDSLSSIKMTLEERVGDYLAGLNGEYEKIAGLGEGYEWDNIADLENERAIGLNNKENNCCINATLQIILNNPALRSVWKQRFKDTAAIYYTALNAGKSSAPKALGTKFREELVQNSHSNLIDKALSTQEDPTAFLEVFFNACKGKGLDLSPMEIKFETMKYQQVAGKEKKPSIEDPEDHKEFRISINNHSDQKIKLEDLLMKHCLEINEIEKNGIKTKYIAENRYVSLPFCLIIDLLTNKKRVFSNVFIPTNLRIPQNLLKNKDSMYEYELDGFVAHLGDSHNSGHYIAFRKVNGQWKKFDDAIVTDVSENELEQVLTQKEESIWQKLKSRIKPSIQENLYPYILSYSKKSSL